MVEKPLISYRDPITGGFIGFPVFKGDKGDKQDKLAKVVKALTKAEFDALPKKLQNKLKEYR